MPITVGDADAAFTAAANVVRERMIHRGGPFFMECRGGSIASYDAVTDADTVDISIAGLAPHQARIADLLELNDNEMHYHARCRRWLGSRARSIRNPCVAAAPASLGRPVKWIEDRRQNFLAPTRSATNSGPPEPAVDRDAHILGLRGGLIHDTGALVPRGLVLPRIAATTVPGPYVDSELPAELNVVYTT